MKNYLAVLFAVAEELAETAENNMPKLKKGETIINERFEKGVYCRETIYENKKFVAEFNFATRQMNFW